MKNRSHLIIVCTLLLFPLTACSGETMVETQESQEEVIEHRSSASKSAVYSFAKLRDLLVSPTPKPSSTYGVYISLFLGSDATIRTLSALDAVDAHIKIFRSEESTLTDETFALLQEYGSLLQVDIIDMLNRSANRVDALDNFLLSLTTLNALVEEKMEELNDRKEIYKQTRREQRGVVSDIKRNIRTAEKEQDFSRIGREQEALARAEAKLAETESRENEIKRVISVYDELLEIGEERLGAITKNRDILIAGLRVIDVPGIDDLGIYMKE